MTFNVKSDKVNAFGESKLPQLWRNPADNRVYASYKAPKYGFKEVNAWAIYDLGAHQTNVKEAQQGTGFAYNAFLDSEFEAAAESYLFYATNRKS